MPRKRHKPEEIVAKLRQVDVMAAQGVPLGEAIHQGCETRGVGARAADQV